MNMKESVRAFLAIELPEQAKAALGGLVEKLRMARIRGLRPVNAEGIHLTLKFLGDVPRTQIEPIAAEVARVVKGHRPFTVALSVVGVFPSGASPRVLWVGLKGDLPSLVDLHQSVEGALDGLGFARERRGFSPHLTVARINDRTPLPDRRRAVEVLEAAESFESGPRIDVGSVSLMRSILLPERARYERLALIPLRGGLSNT